jgi:hypothetical protein
MPDVGPPEHWPDWCMGFQPISPASEPRLRVVMQFHFEADQFAGYAEHFEPMEVWRDQRGRWSVSPRSSGTEE